ncbi:hypothetical protein D3C86_1882090 [compost metagenome]
MPFQVFTVCTEQVEIEEQEFAQVRNREQRIITSEMTCLRVKDLIVVQELSSTKYKR